MTDLWKRETIDIHILLNLIGSMNENGAKNEGMKLSLLKK